MRYNVDHKEKMMGVRFTNDCWDDLEYLSNSLGLSRAKVIRKAIQDLAHEVRKVRAAERMIEEG